MINHFRMKQPIPFTKKNRKDFDHMRENVTNEGPSGRSLTVYDDDDIFSGVDSDIDVFDVDKNKKEFGEDAENSGRRRRAGNNKRKRKGCEDSSLEAKRSNALIASPKKEPGSMLDDLIENQTKLLQSSSQEIERPIMSTARRIGEQSTMDDVGKKATRSPWSDTLTTDWAQHDDSNLLPAENATLNYHYQLYKLHSPQSSNVPMGRGLPSINVLVRHHVHGLSMENVNVTGKKLKFGSYIIQPKVEHQAFFGCEVNTHAEIVKQYAELLLRPNTYILQLRICAASSQIILSEEKDLSEVIREGHQPHIQFQPLLSLSSLHCIFNSLCKLTDGHYLLHHANKSDAFIRLLRNIDEGEANSGLQSVYNLHTSYGYSRGEREEEAQREYEAQHYSQVIDRRKYNSAPWLPIDTNVLTPFHLTHKKIPCTFPMPRKQLSKKDKKNITKRAKLKKSIHDTPKEAADATSSLYDDFNQ